MSIAKQMNATLNEAKQVFGEVLAQMVDAVSADSDTFVKQMSQALKDAIQHIQNEYGYAIAFYIANDFQRCSNSDPRSPFTLNLEFIYAPDGADPSLN